MSEKEKLRQKEVAPEIVASDSELISSDSESSRDTTAFLDNFERHREPNDDAETAAPKFIGGKYRVVQLVGRGGMGDVYKVHHIALDKVYAAKVLKSDVTTDFKLLQRFDQEAKSAGSLNHPNLVSVHDYGTSDDGTPYFIMEFLEGHSLEDDIKKNGPLEEKRALHLFAQVCDALKHAHEKGIIHRDIKPSNLMLVKSDDGSETVKIVDFGIAKREVIDNKVTQTGEVFGTPLYMSPEQCVGKPCDARSDVYSLGCVMYEALTGVSPFAAENAVQTILKHMNEAPAPLKKANPKLSPGIEQLVAACLQKAPDDRIQSAELLAFNLRRIEFGKNPIFNSRLLKLRGDSSTKLKTYIAAALLVIFTFFIGYAMNNSGTGSGPYPRRDTRPFATMLEKGVNETKQGNYSGAVTTLEEGLKIARAENAPHLYQVRYLEYLTNSNYQLHDYPKARLAAYELAELHLSKNELAAADAYANRIWKYARSGDRKNLATSVDYAISVREKALGKNSPELFDMLVQKAWNLDRAGKTEQATQVLDRALDLARNNPRKVTMQQKYLAFDRLSKYLKKTGETKRAQEVLDEALASTDDAPEEILDILQQRRETLQKQGNNRD